MLFNGRCGIGRPEAIVAFGRAPRTHGIDVFLFLFVFIYFLFVLYLSVEKSRMQPRPTLRRVVCVHVHGWGGRGHMEFGIRSTRMYMPQRM